LLLPDDQGAQVGGIAPSGLDRFAKNGISIVLKSTSKWNANSTAVESRAMSLFAVSQYSAL
jgi:hypothetical protein